jgi:YVTN family beta-propeller protein
LELRVSLAGGVAVQADGVVIGENRFPGRQGRLLFAYLVLEQARPVPRDELAEALWGEVTPPTWDKALTVLASKLRALLTELGSAEKITLTGAFGCYRLDLPEGTWVDVLAAVKAVQEAEAALAAGDLENANAAAMRAESLTRHPFLPGEEGSWVDEKRRELADVRGRALGCLADANLGLGNASATAKWAEEAIVLEPFREAGYRRLMDAHTAGGNRAEALRVYERCRLLLAEELGAYPSPETDAIYRELLRASPPDVRAVPAAGPVSGGEGQREREAPFPLVAQLRWRGRSVPLVITAVALALVGAASAVVMLLPSRRAETTTPLASLAGDSVAVIDPASNAVVDEIPIGGKPAGIAIGFGSIWVGNSQQKTLLRIDPATREVVRTIGLPVAPWRIAVGAGTVWVASRDSNAVVAVDPTFNQATDRIDLGQSDVSLFDTFDLAVGGGAVWVAHGGDLISRISTSSKAIVRQIRAGSAAGIVYGDGAAWSLSGSGRGAAFERFGLGALSRVDPTTNSVTRPIQMPQVGRVSPGPNGLAFGNGSIWVIKPDGTLIQFDSATGRLGAVVRLGESATTAPTARKFRPLDVTLGEGAVWVPTNGGTVSRVDPVTARVLKTIPLGRYPRRAYPVEVAAGEGGVWVTMH